MYNQHDSIGSGKRGFPRQKSLYVLKSLLTDDYCGPVDAVAGEEDELGPLVVRLEAQADAELGVVARDRGRVDHGGTLCANMRMRRG